MGLGRRTSHASARAEGDVLPSRSSLDTRCNGLRPPAGGMGEALGAIAEKICLAARGGGQALLRRRMWFDRAGGPGMAQRQSARSQRAAAQQAAMAVERVALGAKHAP